MIDTLVAKRTKPPVELEQMLGQLAAHFPEMAAAIRSDSSALLDESLKRFLAY